MKIQHAHPDAANAEKRLKLAVADKMKKTAVLLQVVNSLQEETLELLKAIQSPTPHLTKAYSRLSDPKSACQRK